MPWMHDLYTVFLPQYSKPKKLQNNYTPPKKKHEDLVWLNQAVEYLTLPANHSKKS